MIRQWISFPPAVGTVRTSRLRHFLVLIETSRGRLLFVSLRAKAAPDEGTAARIVALLGDCDPYLDISIANALLDELGLHAQILDCPFDREDEWLATPIAAEAVLDETLTRTRRGQQLGETDRLRFKEQLRCGWQTGFSEAIVRLDGIAVEAARTVGGGYCRPSPYNYFRAIGAPDGIRQRNRIQAAAVFPFLFPLLPTDPWLAPVRRAIDDGEPRLVDVLAWRFAAPKAVIRSLRHQPATSIGPQWASRPNSLTKILTDILAGHRPQTPEMWQSFNTTADLIAKISGRPIECTSNRLWLRAAAQQGYPVADIAGSADDELERAARDIDEFRGRLADALNYKLHFVTESIRALAVAAAVRALVIAHNPIRLTRLARRWRDAYIREQARFSDERQLWIGALWPAVMSVAYETATRRIVCLTTAAELVAEGKEMHNCVAGYVGSCLKGRSQIWSVQDLDGKHCSTLETRVKEGFIRIAQHAGPKNVNPTGSCTEAANSLISHLRDQTAEVNKYARWKQSIASRPMNERTLIALYKPIIAAFDETLPKQWSLERLLSIAKDQSGEKQPRQSAAISI